MNLFGRFFQFVVLLFVFGWTLGASPATCYKCKKGDTCKPPTCVCCGKDMPLEKSRTPQMVFFTFDDAVNTYVASFYRKLFDANRRNPNGCPISMTLFISHANTVYSLVREFYQKGFEIASHSVTHSHPNMNTFKTEAGKQKENLAKKARIPISEIQGWRSPFLEPMGDAQPNILQDLGYSYDATLTVSKGKQTEKAPVPFTLDYGWPYDCKINPCPKSAHRGFWEVPVVSVTDYLGEYECVYVDGCNNPPPDEESAYNFLWENFNSYYKTNKAPFGINMHAAWFYVPDRFRAMDRFIQDLLKLDDVYIVSVKQVIAWLKTPVPIGELKDFQPWSCANPRDRDAPKLHAKGHFANKATQHHTAENSVPKSEIAHTRYNAHAHGDSHRRTNAHSQHHSYVGHNSDTQQRSYSAYHTGNTRSNQTPSHQSFENSYLYQKMMKRKALREQSTTTTTTLPPPPVKPGRVDLGLSIPKPPLHLLEQTKQRQHVNSSPIYSWQPFLTRAVNRETKHQETDRKSHRETSSSFINRPSHGSHDTHHQHSHWESHHVPPKINVPRLPDTWSTSHGQNEGRIVLNAREFKNKESTTQKPISKFDNVYYVSNIEPVSNKANQTDLQSPVTTTKSPEKESFKFISPWNTENGRTESPVISSLNEWLETQQKQKHISSSQSKNNNILFQSSGFQFHNAETTTEKSVVEQSGTKDITAPPNTETLKESSCKQGVNCKMPECFCKTTKYPTDMSLADMPQIVYITVDGPLNFLTYSKMKTLFKENRQNPNGCRIGATFFANGRGTSYRLASMLNNDGIEIGLNGQQTTSYETSEGLQADIDQQSDHLRIYSGITDENIRGWRSSELSEQIMPYINVLRNKTLYDSSLVMKNKTGLDKNKPWPFTLDFGVGDCEGENCSSTDYAGIWEVPVIPMKTANGETCAYADKCREPKSTQETVDYLMKNFNSYYEKNKAPFGIHISRDWFYWYNNKNFAGLSEFVDTLLQKKDVYIVSVSNLLQWMKNPVSLSSTKSFASWGC
ncbi:uncharacterized protein LOC111130788 [Crassostrea virginica]